MSQQRRTIIGACDYSIAYMQNLKKDLSIIDSQNPELSWGVGGMIASMVSNLIQTCESVISDSFSKGGSNAKQDLEEIMDKFQEFIGRMINAE